MIRIYSSISDNAYIVETRENGKWEFVASLKSLREAWVIVWNILKKGM